MQDIKALRKRLGLSQRQFAERLGVKRRTIIRWESSLRTPNQEFQRRLSQLEANVTDENVTDENVTDQNVTDENVNSENVNSENVNSEEVSNPKTDNPDNPSVDNPSVSNNNVRIKKEHIRATYAMLAHQTPVELRIFPKNGYPVVETASTEDEFIPISEKWNGKAQIYCGVRERRAGFLSGKEKGKAGDANDIVAVTLTVVDIDPIRAKGFAKQPTTDEELAKAILASSLLAQWHEGRGFLRPARAM